MSVHKIIKSDFHRNGICGAGFCVTLFDDHRQRRLLGIRFDAPGHCAVFDLNLLAQGIIEFGLNSWRGDHYESDLPAPDGQVFSPVAVAPPAPSLWDSDPVQFARFLAELRAIALTESQYAELESATDCTREDIDEIFERAESAWQRFKEPIA